MVKPVVADVLIQLKKDPDTALGVDTIDGNASCVSAWRLRIALAVGASEALSALAA